MGDGVCPSAIPTTETGIAVEPKPSGGTSWCPLLCGPRRERARTACMRRAAGTPERLARVHPRPTADAAVAVGYDDAMSPIAGRSRDEIVHLVAEHPSG